MKIFKNIKYFLICFITLLLEMTVGKHLAVNGTVPMLSFCLCLVIGVKESEPNYIIFIGIAMGVLLDLFSGHGFGSYTVTFSLSVLVTYLLRDNIFSSKVLFMICNTFILSICYCIVYFLLHILDVGISFGSMLGNIALPTAIYNILICVIIYYILSPTLYKRR